MAASSLFGQPIAKPLLARRLGVERARAMNGMVAINPRDRRYVGKAGSSNFDGAGHESSGYGRAE